MKNDQPYLPFQARLIKLLQKEVEGWGSYIRLEAEIKKANRETPGLSIDRRKLTAIVNGEDVKFTFQEIHALDVYITRQGLSPLFEKPSILESLARKRCVKFLLGAKRHEETTDVSRWDVRAMAILQRSIDRHSNAIAGLRFETIDVLLPQQLEPASGVAVGTFDPLKQFAGEEWLPVVEEQTEAASLVCIGSPRACVAAELMLGKMFQVAPFKSQANSRFETPPFRFIWSKLVGTHSSFARIEERPDDSNALPHAVGVEIESKRIYSDSDGPDTWKVYGLLAAQRRMSGEVWLVVAGLTGGATEATAQFLKTFDDDLPPADPQAHSKVLWAVVEAEIGPQTTKDGAATGSDGRSPLNKSLTGDDRKIASWKLFRKPELF